MEVSIDKSFEKDVKKIKVRKVLYQIANKIEEISEVESLYELSGIKKIKGFDGYYRIRLGDYRIGIELVDNTVIFL